MDFFEYLRKAMLAGFGAQDRVKEFLDELVKKGELSDSQGAKLAKEWTEKAEKSSTDINKSLADLVNKTLEKMNMPSKDDVEKLRKEMKTLSSKIKKLEESKGE
jgi:poly(hydroxyalkanoate) granule-associated protein